MSEITGGPLAVSDDGKVVAIGEGSEILAYNAANEAPEWIAALPADAIALAAAKDEILALDARGGVSGHAASDGAERWRLGPFGAGAKLGVSVDGRWAVASEGVLRVGERDHVGRTIPLADPAVVAVAFAGDVPAVGYADGRIRMLPEKQEAITRQAFEPLADLASDTDGVLVAASEHLARMPIEGRGTVIVSYPEPITKVARSATGMIHAILVGDRYAAAHANDGADDLGMVRYHDRVVGGIAVDPQGNLWASCGVGHANKVDFSKSVLARTDPHPGRERSSWLASFKSAAEDGGETPDAVQQEREVAAAKAMPLGARILISVIAIVAVLGGWLAIMWALG